MKRITALIACLCVLNACQQRPDQNDYSESEAGISRSVQFGTVLNTREITLHDKASGGGALIGGATGAGVGSAFGNGSGQGWAILAGAIIGAVAGNVVEEENSDHQGLEYVVQLQSGDVKTIAQEVNEGDIVFKAGDKVMLQYCDGGDKSHKCADKQYQRLLPVKKLPPYVRKKKMQTTHEVPAPEIE